MMGAVTPETCMSSFAVNKYLHTVASVGFLFTLNYDARNHELKKIDGFVIIVVLHLVQILSISF